MRKIDSNNWTCEIIGTPQVFQVTSRSANSLQSSVEGSQLYERQTPLGSRFAEQPQLSSRDRGDGGGVDAQMRAQIRRSNARERSSICKCSARRAT